jgi:hypothetical protein
MPEILIALSRPWLKVSGPVAFALIVASCASAPAGGNVQPELLVEGIERDSAVQSLINRLDFEMYRSHIRNLDSRGGKTLPARACIPNRGGWA